MKARFIHTLLLLIYSLFLLQACSDKTNTSPTKANTVQNAQSQPEDGTAEMIQILKETGNSMNAQKVAYVKNSERAAFFKNRSENSATDSERLTNLLQYAYELLNAGQNENAIMEFEKLLQIVEKQGIDPNAIYQVRRLLALSYIRLGEQNNCITNSNPDRCIMPFEGKGIYEIKTSVQSAIDLYKKILATNPNDPESIWMLNFAYMTLGEYPESVPTAFRLNEAEFESDYQIPKFENIASKLGVNTVGISGGAAVEDFDNDGFLDIFASSMGVDDQIRFFKNNGDGTFSDKTSEAGLTGITGGLNINHADYNNDGLMDVLVLRGAWFGAEGAMPNSLLKNMGNGKFIDVTKHAGLFSQHPTQTATWADFNNDGWLDLFIGNESEANGQAFPCELFMSNGNGSFSNQTVGSGLENILGMVKGCASGDINNDGLQDLYVSLLKGNNQLFLNNGTNKKGQISFSANTQASVTEPLVSFPCWFWDFNNDGWEDLFVAGFGLPNNATAAQMAAFNFNGKFMGGNPSLYQNNGDGTFNNIAQQAGLTDGIFTMGSNYGDIDNDGYLDCYLGTGEPSYSALVPNKMFRNNKGQQFQDVTTAGGFGHVQKGHGVGFGDFDNDGDQDIFCVLGGAFEGDVFEDAFFLNPFGNEKSWVTLQLEGITSNKAAIGARVKLTTTNSKSEENNIYRTVSTGSSFGSNSLQLEIGLDDATLIKSIEVRWPNSEKSTQTFENVEVRRFVKIVEGSSQVQYLERKVLNFES